MGSEPPSNIDPHTIILGVSDTRLRSQASFVWLAKRLITLCSCLSRSAVWVPEADPSRAPLADPGTSTAYRDTGHPTTRAPLENADEVDSAGVNNT